MMRNASFQRKVIYICIIAALLFPLVVLGRPAVRTATGGSSGGVMARYRAEHGLSQAQLGEIDPTGAAMQLATLGMRGVAVNILWMKSFEYKKKKDWDNLSATLNQITKLQPHFIKVWENQAHNLTYNVSIEFDDYHHRYHWVKKGIDFLIVGTRYNRHSPRLLGYTGTFFGQKIGVADEHRQFRRLFRNDTDFHGALLPYVPIDDIDALGPDEKPDNWLVSRLWHRQAEDAVDNHGARLGTINPLVFYNHAPKARINYASAIENEGYLDEVGFKAWAIAGRGWFEFGKHDLMTSWGVILHLNQLQEVSDKIAIQQVEFDKLTPGVRELVYQQKYARLSDKERAALETPRNKRSQAQGATAYQASQKITVSHQEVADQAPLKVRVQADLLAGVLKDLELHEYRVKRYRKVVNYDYWAMRCEVEQMEKTARARRLVEEGRYQAKTVGALELAKTKYEEAWILWAEIFEQFPEMKTDVIAEDLMPHLSDYRYVLDNLAEEVPNPFILREIINIHRKQTPAAAPGVSPPTEPAAQ